MEHDDDHSAKLPAVSVALSLTAPRIIEAAGLKAKRRFFEFFTATIRNRNTREAEAVAYVVLTACGLVPNTASSDYIQLYQGTPELLLESLERIQQAVSQILPLLKADAQLEPA